MKHLILADPWGLPQRPPAEESKRSKMPWWVRALVYTLEPLNPLWAVRFAGPFGESNSHFVQFYCTVQIHHGMQYTYWSKPKYYYKRYEIAKSSTASKAILKI